MNTINAAAGPAMKRLFANGRGHMFIAGFALVHATNPETSFFPTWVDVSVFLASAIAAGVTVFRAGPQEGEP